MNFIILRGTQQHLYHMTLKFGEAEVVSRQLMMTNIECRLSTMALHFRHYLQLQTPKHQDHK